MKLLDRAHETTTSTGTGTLSLAGPATGCKSFLDAVGNNVSFGYVISTSGANWECGIGHITSDTTFHRDVILCNWLGTTSPLTLVAGTKQVFSDATAFANFFQLDTVTPPRTNTRPSNERHLYPNYFGTGEDGDVTLSTDQTIEGTKNYRTLIVTAGNIRFTGRVFVQRMLLITGGHIHCDGLSASGPTAPGAWASDEYPSQPGGQTNDGPTGTAGFAGQTVVGDGGAGGNGGNGGNP